MKPAVLKVDMFDIHLLQETPYYLETSVKSHTGYL